jgi:hypothetical protein
MFVTLQYSLIENEFFTPKVQYTQEGTMQKEVVRREEYNRK